MATTDPIMLLSRSLTQTGDVIAAVRPEQVESPTPCQSWNVRQLLEHILFDLRQFIKLAAGDKADWTSTPSSSDDDVLTAYRSAAEELLSGWRRAGDLTDTVMLPNVGEAPLMFPLCLQISELALHAWDLARATGQPVSFDEEVGQISLDWMRANMKPEYRAGENEGGMFGPEVPIADDAPVYDRLAAFAGRDPRKTVTVM